MTASLATFASMVIRRHDALPTPREKSLLAAVRAIVNFNNRVGLKFYGSFVWFGVRHK